jgi:glutamate-1-semialdehyde aminotransferase
MSLPALPESSRFEKLTQEKIDKMEVQAQRLARELRRAAKDAELPFSVRQFGSLMNTFFTN